MNPSKVVSNESARATWERKAVGSDRAKAAEKGTPDYFKNIRAYRYGYETPFIPEIFDFAGLSGKRVLEIGVGNGIDAVEMMRHGARYTGLDITRNHLDLTRRYIELEERSEQLEALIEGDLLDVQLSSPFDVVYSFGVLHHIAHEVDYLRAVRSLLKPDGELRLAVYSKWSFFNAYLLFTWLAKNRLRNRFDDWRSHVAEYSELGNPVTIKIRSRREVEAVLRDAGFTVKRYSKRGFVQRYIPLIGERFDPSGPVLRTAASGLGWYHCFTCSVD